MVGIKDMKMPKCCDDCCFYISFEKYCGANHISFDNVKTSEERHPQCPLVEIGGK